jgi:hypothetical protein
MSVRLWLISLACKGPVVIRSVFEIRCPHGTIKRDDSEGTSCTLPERGRASLTHVNEGNTADGPVRNASPVVRCELELPNSGGSEEEHAVKGKETNCWLCGSCEDGNGCPSIVGKWYSDSYTTTATGCDFDPSRGYYMHRTGIVFTPDTKIQLARFEVCNIPGCSDPEYERQKLKRAKPCVKGVCAP